MFNFSVMDSINSLIENGAKAVITEKKLLELEIAKWKKSKQRKDMLTGVRYYSGEHDILNRKRTVIGKDGELEEVRNLPNNKNIDNQYEKVVDQKNNYLLGKPLTFETQSTAYAEALGAFFDEEFQLLLSNIGENALNCGIAWVLPYYDGKDLKLKRFMPYECLPFWKDAEHRELDKLVRVYSVSVYNGEREQEVEMVEVYSLNGIDRYTLNGNGELMPDEEMPHVDYLTMMDNDGKTKGLNWERIPLIAFRYANEKPLINRVKPLQDAINVLISDFQNNMQEDFRNTILVIKNYEGENLGELRHNLMTLGMIKVTTIDGIDGGVDALKVEVNSANYEAILRILKAALIENARAYDAKEVRMGSTPNQMNILSMYNDIDLDANKMELEFQASFKQLLWFVNTHFANAGVGDFSNEKVKVIFNRDMIINESEIVSMLSSLGVRISNETLLGQVPFINDVPRELERLKKEEEATANMGYELGFNQSLEGVDNGKQGLLG